MNEAERKLLQARAQEQVTLSVIRFLQVQGIHPLDFSVTDTAGIVTVTSYNLPAAQVVEAHRTEIMALIPDDQPPFEHIYPARS